MKTKIITICFLLVLQLLFVSENCKSQWIKTNGPAGGSGPYSFTVIGSAIFAGTTSGLYRSTDYGSSWTITSLNTGNIRGLAYSGSNIYAGTTAGLKISTDNGTTWSTTTLTSSINAVVANGPYIFAGASGLWRSTDFGQTWNRLTTVPYQTIYSLAIDGPLVYAGTGSYGVYRSTDNGDNWVQRIFNNEPIHALAIKGARVFATCESSFWGINYGIYGSTDYGDTWPIRALTNRDIWSFAVCGDYIFAGDQEDPTGVYRSSDDGLTWVQTALNNVNIYALSFIGSTIFAGTSQELFISTDNGQTWPYNVGILNQSSVYSLAASETNIFAGTNKFIYKTSDNGQHWISDLNKYTYCMTANNTDIFAGTYGSGVYRSSDNGQTWEQTALGNYKYIYALAASGFNIFAGDYGVYRSTDNGQTWALTSLNNRSIYSLAISGSNIFAGTSGYGVYFSSDNGQTWNQTTLNNRSVYALVVSGNNILAGTTSYGVYISSDNGQTWSQTTLNNRTIYTFDVSGSYIFAGTSSYGVYYSTNNGQTWQTWGMDATTINQILIKDNNIYAATSNKAVWKRYKSDLIPPNLISPVNDSVINSYTPVLNWEDMNGVSYYSLKVSKDINFETTVVDVTNLTEPNYTIPSGILEYSTSYYWKVSAMGGAWSEVWKFSVPVTPQYSVDKIEIVKGNILDLLNSNIISQDNYEMLVSKLNNAIQQIEQQHYEISINMIEQFIFEIDLLKKKLILTPEQAQPLVYKALVIIDMLNILNGGDNLLRPTDGQVSTYKLNNNYPNPFNPVTTIKFSIANDCAVNLSVYDVTGRLVKNIVNTNLVAGGYEYQFNGANLASGIYFCKLVTQNFTDIKKMVLIK